MRKKCIFFTQIQNSIFFTERFRAEVANNGAGCAYQPAADMMQLTWDDDLRKTARELLDKKSIRCILLKFIYFICLDPHFLTFYFFK
jgi:hypothetical protein